MNSWYFHFVDLLGSWSKGLILQGTIHNVRSREEQRHGGARHLCLRPEQTVAHWRRFFLRQNRGYVHSPRNLLAVNFPHALAIVFCQSAFACFSGGSWRLKERTNLWPRFLKLSEKTVVRGELMKSVAMRSWRRRWPIAGWGFEAASAG